MEKVNGKKDYEVPSIKVLVIEQQKVICTSDAPRYNGFGEEEEM